MVASFKGFICFYLTIFVFFC